MDDSPGVGLRQTLRHLQRELEGAGGREGPATDEGGQGLPADQLHGDEGVALRLVDLIDHRDGRVGERGGGLRLLAQAALALGIVLGAGGQDLERPLAAEAVVQGAVDRAHAAVADLGNDRVVGQRPADHGAPSGRHRRWTPLPPCPFSPRT